MNSDNKLHEHLEPVNEEEIFALSRPHPNLLKLFIVYSLAGFVFAPFIMIPLYFRYITLRYKFDAEGVSIAYGILWRREGYVTYSRIQDIHVTRNIFERWLGLGTVAIQTASGKANSEESVIGMMEYNKIRNFLYARMRGTKQADATPVVSDNEEIVLLTQIRDELRSARLSREGGSNE